MASMFKAVQRSPLARAALTSATVMCTGDLCCQAIQQRHQAVKRFDMQRALRFGLVGLTLHGPFFYTGFRALDQTFGAKATLKNALTKVTVGQLTLFPVYTTTLFMYLGVLEGKSWQQSWQRLKERFPETFTTGSVFWPAVNMFNFMFIPPTQRIVYINGCGLVWNTFLSWVASRDGKAPPLLQATR